MKVGDLVRVKSYMGRSDLPVRDIYQVMELHRSAIAGAGDLWAVVSRLRDGYRPSGALSIERFELLEPSHGDA